MTSTSFRSRAKRFGTASLVLPLLLGSLAAPLSAQDLRDIPQKSSPPAKKQGRDVQGPPAPLETQLRDTPPDEPVFRPPVAPVPSAPPIVQTNPTPNNGAAPKQAPTKANPATKSTVAPQATERAPVPGARGAAAAVGAAPDDRAASPRDTAAETNAPTGTASPITPDANEPALSPATDVPGAAPSSTDTAIDDTTPAAPANDTGSTLPWALGGAALLGLGGLAYVWRRRRAVPATGSPALGGIELGQTPFADELNSGDSAAAPIAKSLQAPKSKPQPKPVAQPAPSVQALPPAAPPAPVKASSDGRIVSRIRAQAPDAHIPADPNAAERQAPPPAAPPPPAPVKPAADGRIVSRLKVSDIVDEPTPPPAPPPQPRRRRAPPLVKTVSVGYSVNKRD